MLALSQMTYLMFLRWCPCMLSSWLLSVLASALARLRVCAGRAEQQ